MSLRIACLLALFPLALFAANHPSNYDALAELADSPAPAFTWFGGNRSVVAHVHDIGRGAIIAR